MMSCPLSLQLPILTPRISDFTPLHIGVKVSFYSLIIHILMVYEGCLEGFMLTCLSMAFFCILKVCCYLLVCKASYIHYSE